MGTPTTSSRWPPASFKRPPGWMMVYGIPELTKYRSACKIIQCTILCLAFYFASKNDISLFFPSKNALNTKPRAFHIAPATLQLTFSSSSPSWGLVNLIKILETDVKQSKCFCLEFGKFTYIVTNNAILHQSFGILTNA